MMQDKAIKLMPLLAGAAYLCGESPYRSKPSKFPQWPKTKKTRNNRIKNKRAKVSRKINRK